MRQMRLGYFLISSICLHFLIVSLLQWVKPLSPPQAPEAIEFVVVPREEIKKYEPSKNMQQIVREAFVPPKARSLDESHPARFKSQNKVRVKEETQAAISGMTHNGGSKNIDDRSGEQDQPAPMKADREYSKSGTMDVAERLKDWKRIQDNNNVSGPSTIGETLPQDVRIGSFTALNTDRYLYYTFYARVEELVRFRWETRVRRATDSFSVQAATRFPGRDSWRTQVLFLLDRRGVLKSAIVLNESGSSQFDLAAIEAFQEAGIFPNPPQEMLEEDGMVHLHYSFQVSFRPRVISREN